MALEASQTATKPEDGQEQGVGVLKAPFWDVTFCEGLTLTSGISDDWAKRFENPSAGTNRVRFKHATAGGELHYWNIGATTGKLFTITWESDNPQRINALLSGSSSLDPSAGVIQFNLNGKITEYTLNVTEHYFTFDTRAGRNYLHLVSGYVPFGTIFRAELFDGKSARWVDPTEQQGYYNA